MYRAVVIKELREIWWIGGLAGGLLLCLVLGQMGLDVDERPPFLFWWQDRNPEWVHRIPFKSDEWPLSVLVLGGLAASGVALWQTLGETVQGTWMFYLFRPAPRRDLIFAKISVGLTAILVCFGAPLLLYALWARTPGTHANPFEWWMTGPSIRALGYLSVAYLAAFLCGLRPARWWGSRLFPAVFACFLWLPIVVTPWHAWPTWLMIIVCDVLLLGAILWVCKERDWA